MLEIEDQELILRCKEGNGEIIATYVILYGPGSESGECTCKRQGEIFFKRHKVAAETPTSRALFAYTMQFRHLSSDYGPSDALYRRERSSDERTFSDFKHLEHGYFMGMATPDPGDDALKIEFIQEPSDDIRKPFLGWFLNCAPNSKAYLYGCAKLCGGEELTQLSQGEEGRITRYFSELFRAGVLS
jgi:hypothetical protein